MRDICTELTQELKNQENSKTGGYHDVDLKAFKDAGWVIEDSDIEVNEYDLAKPWLILL